MCSHAELGLAEGQAARAWSTALLGYALILALAYPILSLALRWTFSNSGVVGGLEVLAPENRDWIRYTIFGGSVIVTCLFAYGSIAGLSRLKQSVMFVAASGGIVGVCGLVFVSGSYGSVVAFAAFFAVFPIIAAAVTVASASTAMAVASGSIAIALASASASISIVAASASTSTSIVVAAAVLTVSAAVAIAFGRAARRFETRPPLPTVLLAVWAITGLLIVCLALRFTPVLDEDGRGAILFLSVLPLVNGLADFASVGLTRWSLRRGVHGLLPWSTLIDLVGAVAIFLSLGCGLVAFIHFVRPQDGVALIDLSALFTELRDPATRGDYWWLLFILFSTLIPTLLHFIVAALAFFTIYPEALRLRIAAWLKAAPKDQMQARSGRLALSFAIAAAVMVPLFVVVETVLLWPAILTVTVDVFEGFARLIGAV